MGLLRTSCAIKSSSHVGHKAKEGVWKHDNHEAKNLSRIDIGVPANPYLSLSKVYGFASKHRSQTIAYETVAKVYSEHGLAY